MRINGKQYTTVNIETHRVPDHGARVDVEKNILRVLTVNAEGAEYWTWASHLKTERDDAKDTVDRLIWELGTYAQKANLTKAELKRQLIRCGVISK